MSSRKQAMHARSIYPLVAAIALLLLCGPAEAAISTIALTGRAPPEGTGVFGIFNVTNATAPS